MNDRDPSLQRLVDQVCDAASAGVELEIRGGGTKRFYGEAPGGAALDTRSLCGISSYEPSELVLTARAGTSLAEVEAALADRGQMLAFEPPRHGVGTTVGGMVAAGLSGPARASAGAVRDHVLGVTLLDGHGDVLHFGGQVMKNVAGYDVSRLLAGSLGILGVLCEVSLKVVPEAAAQASQVLDIDERGAIDTLNRLRSLPVPLDASVWHQGRLTLRWRGAGAAVDAACKQSGGKMLSADPEAYWRSVRDQQCDFFVKPLAPGQQLWRLSVPDTATPIVLEGEQLIEWHGGLRWWRTSAAAAQVRALASAAGGTACLYRGTDKGCGVFAPLPGPLMQIHRRIKQAFDPKGIFNPGRLYRGL